MRRLLALVGAAVALGAPGCALGAGTGEEQSGAPEARPGTRTVERTRVQVVEGLGDSGDFEPSAI